jgi:hypothetical protein
MISTRSTRSTAVVWKVSHDSKAFRSLSPPLSAGRVLWFLPLLGGELEISKESIQLEEVKKCQSVSTFVARHFGLTQNLDSWFHVDF